MHLDLIKSNEYVAKINIDLLYYFIHITSTKTQMGKGKYRSICSFNHIN